MSRAYGPPRLLSTTDEIDTFTCRSTEQTNWLRRHARRSAATGTTKIFTVTPHDSNAAVAYYAWCMAQLDVKALPHGSAKALAATRNPSRCSPDLVLTPDTKVVDSVAAYSLTPSLVS